MLMAHKSGYEGGRAELIPNRVSPMHLKLRPTELTPESCKNNYVRVYTGPADSPADLRRAALELGARTARCLPDVALVAERGGEAGVTLDRPAGQLSDEELLDAWAQSSVPEGIDKGALREHGRRILREAREGAVAKE